jgi:hypothetical protein
MDLIRCQWHDSDIRVNAREFATVILLSLPSFRREHSAIDFHLPKPAAASDFYLSLFQSER